MVATLLGTSRRQFLQVMTAVLAVPSLYNQTLAQEPAGEDPLPSWNDCAAKRGLLDFVARTIQEGSKDFIPVKDRLAVFDNDGTLWPEDPVPFQLAFVIDELKRLSPEHPEWEKNRYIQAALAHDLKTLTEGGMVGLLDLFRVTQAGITVQDFDQHVRDWMKTARHPRFKRPYNELAYLPMLEVLTYMRANGFKTYIVSGGGADFMRVWSDEVYGIPREQVIGTIGPTRFELRDGKPVLLKEPGVAFVDDKAGKPVGIHRQIGRQPVACFGNSDGDLEMLQYTTIGRPNNFGLIVHHTDAVREYAYDKHPKSSGTLIEALKQAPERGWFVVDMKNDWKTIFKPEK